MREPVQTVIFAACLFAAATLACADTSAPFTNPLLPHHADPWIYRHTDGFYYFSATVPEYDRIELRRSATIAGLASAAPLAIWKKHPFGAMAANIWAPELHFIDGAWYVYFAAGSSLSPYDVRLYVLENRSADPWAGSWREKGRLRTGWDSISIDATTFSCAGIRYLVWAQRKASGMEGPLDLYIAEMSNPWTLKGRAVLLSTADHPWELRERRTNEGPAVLQHGGRIFITYSANYIDASYCIGMLWAPADANLLDPGSWTKSDSPVFDSNPAAGVWGPGHNSFTTSADGTTDYLVYHARPTETVTDPAILDPSRNTRVQPFTWLPDGMPDFGAPLANGIEVR